MAPRSSFSARAHGALPSRCRLSRNGRSVTLWAHSPEAAREIVDAGENLQFLPGFKLPPAITVTGDHAAIAPADIIVSVVPSEFLRSTLTRLVPHMRTGQIRCQRHQGRGERTRCCA